ncbi:DUF3396 domain-containing protein [Desulfococcaceae bacterium HSG9]|nr:DUF3396 domain-containing protein [Desulfococcaceae bacterium HSG9]
MSSKLSNDVLYKLSIINKGLCLIKVGLSLTYYFKKGYLFEVKSAVAECCEDYLSMCRGNIHWAAHPKNYSWCDLNKKNVPSPNEWFQTQKLDENSTWEFHYHGGEKKEEASHFRLQSVGTNKPLSEKMKRLSYITASFPPNWFNNNEESFLKLALSWASKLRPVHGYGGLSILDSPEVYIAQDYGKEVYALAKRFPGLEVDYPYLHVLYLDSGIKGVNWLTTLGQKWLSEIGGIISLNRSLDDDYKLYEYSEGVVIQAGPHPEIGDVNRKIIPKYYQKLARILKPIQVKEHKRFHGTEGFGPDETVEWLQRFDD